MELAPTSKLLWSTDGHYFPETYWLANKQGRDAVEIVLIDYVEHKDLTVPQAIKIAKDMFFDNANKLYGLRLDEAGKGAVLPERPKEQPQDGGAEVSLPFYLYHCNHTQSSGVPRLQCGPGCGPRPHFQPRSYDTSSSELMPALQKHLDV